jgi:hypothetical protein
MLSSEVKLVNSLIMWVKYYPERAFGALHAEIIAKVNLSHLFVL